MLPGIAIWGVNQKLTFQKAKVKISLVKAPDLNADDRNRDPRVPTVLQVGPRVGTYSDHRPKRAVDIGSQHATGRFRQRPGRRRPPGPHRPRQN